MGRCQACDGCVCGVRSSIYDNYRWMEQFGDPGFARSVELGVYMVT
jgi:hypothetical protein